MRNVKTTYYTLDVKWRMIYTPQRELDGRTTRLAGFDLQKRVTGDDLGERYVTVNGYAHNYKPAKAFPLDAHINEVMQMLVTDYNAEQWFKAQGKVAA
jgi:hypothetical protein